MPAKLMLTAAWVVYELTVLFFTARADAATPEWLPLAPAASRHAESRVEPVHPPCTLVAQHPWQWSPAAAHHRAIVQILCERTGSRGSGVYVDLGGVVGLLTAHHVVEDGPPFRITWPSGQRDRCERWTADKHRNDVAFVFLDRHPTDVEPLTLATRPSAPGELFEVCGYGGPGTDGRGKTLRHFWATESDRPFGDGKSAATPGAMHGDSGGAILMIEEGVPRLASVVSGGSGRRMAQSTDHGEAAFYPTCIYPAVERVIHFCRRVVARYGGGGCGPGGCPSPGPSPPPGVRPGYELYPPRGYQPPGYPPRGYEPPRPSPYPQRPERGGPSTPPVTPAIPRDRGAGVLGPLLLCLAAGGASVYCWRKRIS